MASEKYLRSTPIGQLTPNERKQLKDLLAADKAREQKFRTEQRDKRIARTADAAKSAAEAKAKLSEPRPVNLPKPPAPRQIGGISGAGAKNVGKVYRMMGGAGGGGGLPENK